MIEFYFNYNSEVDSQGNNRIEKNIFIYFLGNFF